MFVFFLPLFCCFLCCFWFVSKKPVFFPKEKGICCLFLTQILSVSLCFSLAFLASPFSISLSLSLSLYLLLFSSVFLVFLFFVFLLYFGSFFLSLSLFFCFLCFCFMKVATSNYSITKFFLSILSLFFGFLSCSLIEIPCSYHCFSWF